jgi:soluble lytic murein transglycosylase-like protein
VKVTRPLFAVAGALVLAAPAAAHSGYTVRWGDTLTSIATAHRTTPLEVARSNGLSLHGILLAGSHLHLNAASGVRDRTHHSHYVVRRGDTLSALASRFGTTVASLRRTNRLPAPSLIFAGQSLRIPAHAPSGLHASAALAPRPFSLRLAIDHWARVYGVDHRLARALSWMESGYQADVVSPVGAWGAMQVTPSAWAFVEDVLVGARVPQTAEGNVRVGVAYLHHLLHEFGGDERLALGAYYQGADAIRRNGLLPETRAYVADVLALKNRV